MSSIKLCCVAQEKSVSFIRNSQVEETKENISRFLPFYSNCLVHDSGALIGPKSRLILIIIIQLLIAYQSTAMKSQHQLLVCLLLASSSAAAALLTTIEKISHHRCSSPSSDADASSTVSHQETFTTTQLSSTRSIVDTNYYWLLPLDP